MTADEIAIVRNMRGWNIDWQTIAREVGRTVAECRAALGLPTYEVSKPAAMPWDIKPGLFESQPQMKGTSDR